MNADVEKAVDELRAACGDGSFAMSAVSTADVLMALQALRDQEAEIARLQDALAKHVDRVCGAEALLRECLTLMEREDWHGLGRLRLMHRITAHLGAEQ